MRILFLILVALTALVACDNKLTPSVPKIAFVNTDITGIDYARKFSLIDHNGQPRTIEDFRGKLVLVFFGYTQCPDVCPTTLSEMANVMQQYQKNVSDLLSNQSLIDAGPEAMQKALDLQKQIVQDQLSTLNAATSSTVFLVERVASASSAASTFAA